MSKKIIICDDEESIRESLKLILEEKYALIITDTGEQCLEVLKNSQDIGLLLLDIKMPKINGLDLLKVVKERHPDLNVVMITGYRSVETAAEASKLGACGYIVKPFRSEEILATARKNLK